MKVGNRHYGNQVGIIHMDLSKAFDALPYTLLIAEQAAYNDQVYKMHACKHVRNQCNAYDNIAKMIKIN